MRIGLIAVLVLAVAGTPAFAQDIPAASMGAIHDVASSEALTKNGKLIPPEVQRAQETLRREKFLTPTPVATPAQQGLLKRWGDALFMGPRAAQFVPEIAAVRDATMSRDLEKRHAAVTALYVKAGRPAPTAEAMKQIDAKLDEIMSGEPEETVRHVVTKPTETIEVTRAPRARETTVEVIQRGADGKPVRTVFRGEEKTRPTADGRDMEVTTSPTGTCTITEAQSADARAKLNGKWAGSNGSEWTISGSGGDIVLDERRPSGHTMRYTGTYRLGKVVAFHGLESAQDSPALPPEIGAQLVGWSPKPGYTARFDLCGTSELKGTWASQHVTYSTMGMSVTKVHNPYDTPLRLTRGAGGLKVAQGGRFPEEGP